MFHRPCSVPMDAVRGTCMQAHFSIFSHCLCPAHTWQPSVIECAKVWSLSGAIGSAAEL